MLQRNALAQLILAIVVASVLTSLMVYVDAQAQITFVSHRDGNAEIYVMDSNGHNQRRLTNNRHLDWYPSWAPDGKRIVFASERDGHVQVKHGWLTSEIYVMDADGRNPQNLTNHPEDDGSPSWSPDGKRIVFMSDREEPVLYFDIYVMDADGNNLQRLTENPKDDRDPSWSPDGKRIVFRARKEEHFENKFGITYEIYVMDDDGDNLQRLTENRKNDMFPSWSPDGKRITFASDRKGDFVNFEIYVMDTDGNNLQKLTENRIHDWKPSWSPDGKQIVFASDRKGNFENFEIYVMDDDGSNPRNLTNHPKVDEDPSWLSSPFSVFPAGKKFTMWGWLKRLEGIK